ncbi:hypothetical protein HDU83_001628 [Entophlyctis luteolus]|nr:hypothetical protein HDU83_001628 [Entophlyctis luteolus]KAJ3390505.1 hypothetical protein HDU84_007356 [Entophlyctis sp. JEL0112]
MPLYDLVCISRLTKPLALGEKVAESATAKAVGSVLSSNTGMLSDAVKPLMRTVALRVLDSGGVVRGFQKSSELDLPYRMRRHQETFSQGLTWAMQFDASPRAMAGLRRDLSFDERVIRFSVVKLGDSLRECTGAYTVPAPPKPRRGMKLPK